jgi:glycosyltransferase involved in cell wall biosynthesis
MKLSVIIPCFNECDTILEIVDKVKNAPVNELEIIIVI